MLVQTKEGFIEYSGEGGDSIKKQTIKILLINFKSLEV